MSHQVSRMLAAPEASQLQEDNLSVLGYHMFLET